MLWFIKAGIEYKKQTQIDLVPPRCRGIYVLYQQHGDVEGKFDVVYVGMAAAGRKSGIRGRLTSHVKKKAGLWSHFSAFEVWDNITDDQVAEFEGLFRHIYRHDSRANSLNIQRRFKKMRLLPQIERFKANAKRGSK
ncbi:MAG: GIY-YIG nuclease family protein [Planctomycetes bacterium]|nr:GIY-YIG nuclease family protein [Planctomycetota bacterium]